MFTRIGKVTNVYPTTGKVKVVYEDENNTSLPLSMLTMNNEYSMPAVGDRVVTLHMENGSSKGFVLGTFYGGSKQPKAKSGYRKDLGDGAYIAYEKGSYLLKAPSITIQADNLKLSCAYGEITVEDLLKRLDEIEQKIDALGGE